MGHRSKRHHRERWGNGGNRRNTDSEIEHYLRYLCSGTRNSEQCWKIIKPEISRFTENNSKAVAGIVTDLAIAKSDEINDQLNRFHRDSRDDELKDKYISCSKNYNDANRNLVIVKRNLDFGDYWGIATEVNDADQELRSCKHEFDKESFDPAHIRNRNKEFGHYMEIVKAATNFFLKQFISN